MSRSSGGPDRRPAPSATSRFAVAAIVGVAAVLVVALGVVLAAGDTDPTAAPTATPTPTAAATTPTPTPTPSATTPTPTPTPTPEATPAVDDVEVPAPEPSPRLTGPTHPSAQTRLVQVLRLTGDMAPKSIVANDAGTLFAQNMMYRHTISVFDADGALVRTIPDAVELAEFGIEGHPGTSRGAPVEMAFSPDGRTAWVSNYSMYGEGFGPEGSDTCRPEDGHGNSFLYRVDVRTLEIVDAVEVGAVPKYVATTPDGAHVLVTNWCTWDLSVVDAETAEEVARIPLEGAYPRGIAVSSDGTTAYVAMMGSDRIATVDLQAMELADADWARPGDGPRHLVRAPDGDRLYVTNNGSGTVAAIDPASGEVVASVATGVQPRSMAVSDDGGALYVVNYGSDTLSKLRASDLTVLQEVDTEPRPIGVTHEPTRRRVWVASYDGILQVFDDAHRTLD